MTEGRYSIQEIENQTQVPAGTLRQWERRYGFPQPERTDGGHRLFSSEDLASIEAMKAHIDNGVPSSRAAKLVKQTSASKPPPKPGNSLKQDLVNAFLELDEARVNHVLSQAFALHTVDVVLMDIIQVSIVELGQLWHDGEIDIATEHFASNLVQAKLRSLLTVFADNSIGPKVMISCAPLEMHELGALMLAVLLRQAGYRVYYLGANTPLADLRALAVKLKPAAVLISATTSHSLKELHKGQAHLDNIAPFLAFGGLAFMTKPEEATALGGQLLNSDIKQAIQQLQPLGSAK